jgi:hypothetical protein
MASSLKFNSLQATEYFLVLSDRARSAKAKPDRRPLRDFVHDLVRYPPALLHEVHVVWNLSERGFTTSRSRSETALRQTPFFNIFLDSLEIECVRKRCQSFPTRFSFFQLFAKSIQPH